MGYQITKNRIETVKESIYEEPYQRFLARLRKARIAAAMTQAEVAHALGKPQSFISKIERGERRLDPLELKEIADLYQLDLGWFFQDTVEAKKPKQSKATRGRRRR